MKYIFSIHYAALQINGLFSWKTLKMLDNIIKCYTSVRGDCNCAHMEECIFVIKCVHYYIK